MVGTGKIFTYVSYAKCNFQFLFYLKKIPFFVCNKNSVIKIKLSLFSCSRLKMGSFCPMKNPIDKI